jgi:glycosyltransferase involved in cell wall biosynthesis
MSAPLVSVITPVYNIENYIGEAIESVLKQSLTDFELILVDDCSTDNSKAIMEDYAQKDPRIKICSTPVNSWAHAAGNVGLQHATGKYIAILDGDDILVSTRLEKQAAFLETHTEYDVVGGWMKKFGESDTIMDTFLRDDLKIRMGQLFDSTMGHGTAMIRRDLIEKYNIRYDTDIFYAHDYHFFTQLAFKAKARFTSLPEIVYLYRWHSEQTSIARRDEQIKFSDQVRREVLSNFYITDQNLIDIHLHFAHKQSYKITAPHSAIIAYYDALIAGNKKSAIFPEDEFRKYLAAKICKDMSRAGLTGLNFYMHFPDKEYTGWSLKQKAKFALKCLRPRKK